MTALKVCMERGLSAGLKFCLGACITIFLQAWVAVAFAGYLNKHTSILSLLKGASVFIFLLLAIVFYFQAIRKKNKQARSDQGKPILLGMGIAAMNLLNIPFYLAAGTVLEGSQYIEIYFPVYFFFIGGLTLGSGAALLCYVYGAKWILLRAKFFTRHLNYFLSGLFLVLAIVQIVQIYYT